MSYVMKYETWMSLTEVKFKIRSKYMTRIDKTRSGGPRAEHGGGG